MKRYLFSGIIFAAVFAGANALVYGQTTVKAKQTTTAAVEKQSDEKKKLAKKQREENMKMAKAEKKKQKQSAKLAKNTTGKKHKKFLGIF